jgi:hypothetical protein
MIDAFLRQTMFKTCGAALTLFSVYRLYGPIEMGMVAGILCMLEYAYTAFLACYNARTITQIRSNDEVKDQTLHG